MRVVVTGATDGIGAAVVALYRARDADVIGTGRRRDATLPDGATYVQADQNEPAAAAEAVALAVRGRGWEAVDRVVLNAGTGRVGEPWDDPTIRETVEVNLVATVLLAHALAPFVLEAGGVLTLVGSRATTAPRFAAYAATKAGLAGLARSLGEEWRGRAHVQCVSPGATRTAMHDKAGLRVGRARALFAAPDAVARAIVRAQDARAPSHRLNPVRLALPW